MTKQDLKPLIKTNFITIFLMLFVWSYLIHTIGEAMYDYSSIKSAKVIFLDLGFMYYLLYIVLSLMTIFISVLILKFNNIYFEPKAPLKTTVTILTFTYLVLNLGSYLLQIAVPPYLFSQIDVNPVYESILSRIFIFDPSSVTSILTDMGYLGFSIAAFIVATQFNKDDTLESISAKFFMLSLPILILHLISEHFILGLEFYFKLSRYAILILGLMFYYMSLDSPMNKYKTGDK